MQMHGNAQGLKSVLIRKPNMRTRASSVVDHVPVLENYIISMLYMCIYIYNMDLLVFGANQSNHLLYLLYY